MGVIYPIGVGESLDVSLLIRRQSGSSTFVLLVRQGSCGVGRLVLVELLYCCF